MNEHTSAAFFERKYLDNPDPWNFSSSPYENSRYSATMRAIGNRRFRWAVEPGCSIGVLTEKLAAVADRVDASDIAPSAVKQARDRCRHLSNVNISVSSLSGDLVGGGFDLLVLSEIGYYFPEADFNQITQELIYKLIGGGVLVAVHWLGVSPDHVLSGDKVHQLLFELDGIRHDHSERHQDFRLDRWLRLC